MQQLTTLEILTNAIPLLEKYDKALIGSVNRDAIMAGQTDIFFQLGLTNPELMASGQKAFTSLFANMKSDMRELVNGFLKTGLNNTKAIGSYNTTLRKAKGIFNKYYKDMFMTGTNAMGNPYYRDLGMTRKDGAFLNKAIRAEMTHMRRFLRDIMNPAHVPRHPYTKRAGYYGESSRAQFLNGMVAGAGKNLDIRWQLNMYGSPLTDHCDYCPAYARRLWTWKTLPTVPRGGDTPCLFRCYCGLQFIPKKGAPRITVPGRPVAEGMMRMSGRFAHVYDAQGQMVGGSFQRQIEELYARMYKARQMIDITTGTTQRSWITLRRSLNSEVIKMMKNRGYRITPTVSVRALTETIKSAQALGGTLRSLTELGIGDEIVFVRGNYSGIGIVSVKKNQIVYQGADGREFVIDDASDLAFVMKRQFIPAKNASEAVEWAQENIGANTVGYENFNLKVANEFNRILKEKIEKFGLGKFDTVGVRYGGETAIMYSTEEGIFVNIGPASSSSEWGNIWSYNRDFFEAYGKHSNAMSRYKGKQTLEYCVVHEVGHQILQKASRIIQEQWNSYFYSLETSYIDNLLSVYATSNPHEFFAEALSIYHMGGIKLPKQMTTLIKSIIKGD